MLDPACGTRRGNTCWRRDQYWLGRRFFTFTFSGTAWLVLLAHPGCGVKHFYKPTVNLRLRPEAV
jgi:hypothetical protein